MRKSDSVFLLTLVDLLVQIIFLSIFIGTIYLANDGKANIEKTRISDPKAKIIVEVGVLKVAEIINSMAKLVPIDRLMELAVLLPEFKSIEALKAALKLAEIAKFDPNIIQSQSKELEKKISYGVGLPSCSIGPEKNKVFLRLQEQDGYYVITKISSKASKFAGENLTSLVEGQIFDFHQLENFGKFITASEKDCRYSVEYQPTNDSFKAYRYVQKYFYTQVISISSVDK
jgi:hypothetical protein